MSKSCHEKKPPVTNQPRGYNEVKQKLDKIGWSEVDPKQYVMKNRVKEDLFGDQYYERDGQEITVKIYMSNVQPNQTWSRIADRLNIGNFPFGTCHAGLQVGSKTVNWYDNSLVTIGDFGASSGFILFSPNENLAVKLSNNLMDKLAELIIEWNIKMTYSKLQNNCQVFVQEFLEVIGLSMPTGPLGKLIKSIREGNTKRRIETKYCGVLEFETHDELDRLEHDHSDPNLPVDKKLTSEEKKILKLFHRGFQMQERAQELMPRRQFICPAGEDPTGLPSNRGIREQENI